MAIRLTQTQRKDKKNLELETGHKFTAREYLLNVGKLKDEYGNRKTSDFFSGSGHQVGIGVNTTSTVNALKSVNSLNGEIRFKKDLINGDKNINLPFLMNGKYFDADSQPLFSQYPQGVSL